MAIGDTLREARLRQRLDIADLEARTKIRAKYLRALENEEWALLPGSTFVRTFLRTYAEEVGLDPHVLVEEYRVNHEPETDYDFTPLAPSPRDPRRARRRAPTRPPRQPPGRWTLFAGLAVLVVGVLLVLGLSGEDDGAEPEERAREATTRTVPERAAERRPARERRRAVTGVRVRLAPEAPTYACIDTGEGTDVVFEGTLDRPRTFRNPRLLRLNLGKRAVDMRANGRRVAIAPSGDPIGFEVSRRGAEEIVDGTRPCA